VGEGRSSSLCLHLDQLAVVNDVPHAGQERPGQHADPALRRIEEGRVVAKGLVLDPQRAVDHVLEVRLGHQPGHPIRRQLVQRDLPELLVERHHEVLGDARAHVVQDPGLEGAILRPGRRRFRERGDEAQQALADDFRREPVGVDLEWVLRVGPVRVDEGAADMLLQPAGQQPLHEGLDRGLAEVEEMARHVEGETVLLIGPAEATRFLLLLDHSIGPVPQVIGGAEPGQAGADDQDHGTLRADSGAGGNTAPFTGLEISMRLSKTAATTARNSATPAMTSAVAAATNSIARAAPPSAASIMAIMVSWFTSATTKSQRQAITLTPPASPSMTSMMLTALMMPIIQTTVSNRSSQSGNAAISMRMPLRIRTKTAMSWP